MEIHVLHTNGYMLHYSFGDDREYESWRMDSSHLTMYRHDGTRVHLLAGSISHIHVDTKKAGTS